MPCWVQGWSYTWGWVEAALRAGTEFRADACSKMLIQVETDDGVAVGSEQIEPTAWFRSEGKFGAEI